MTEEEIVSARGLLQAGHRRQAIDELTMLLELDPKNEEARLLRAVAYQGLEEYDLAIEDYETVLKEDPSSAKGHYNLGMIYSFRVGRPEKALFHFDQFLTSEPIGNRAFTVSQIMVSQYDPEEETERNELRHQIEEVTQETDRSKRVAQLRLLSDRYPRSPLPPFLLAKGFELEGDESDAISFYRIAVQRKPTCGPCHQALGKLIKKVGKSREADIHLKKGVLFNSHPGP
jgi:Tfp pilus assembly protein PilF